MICPKCSRSLPGDLKVCGYCGARLSDDVGRGFPTEVSQPSAKGGEPSTDPKEKRARKWPLIIGVGALGVAGAIAAIIFIPSPDSPDEKPPSITVDTSTTVDSPITVVASTTVAPPATVRVSTTNAASPFIGQWVKSDPEYSDLPGELMVVVQGASGLRIEIYNSRGPFCDPPAPDVGYWTAQESSNTLTGQLNGARCLGQPLSGASFEFSWSLQATSGTLKDRNDDYWRPAVGLDPADFFPESPYVGTWTAFSGTTGGRYLYVITATPTGFESRFYGEQGYWCPSGTSPPVQTRSAGTLGSDGELRLIEQERTCLGSPTETDTGWEFILRFDPTTGTLLEEGDETVVWTRTYDLHPGDLYPDA